MIGGLLVSVSFVVPWTSGDFPSGPDGTSPWLTQAYLTWLGFVLCAGVVVFGLLGARRSRPHPRWRVMGCLFGVTGIILTYFAWYQGADIADAGGFPHSFEGAGVGSLMAMAGFFVAAIGAALGPHRITVIAGAAPKAGGRSGTGVAEVTGQVVAGTLTVIGGVVLLMSFSAFAWASKSSLVGPVDAPGSYTVKTIASFADFGHALMSPSTVGTPVGSVPWLSLAYFTWLAFVLLIGVVVFGLLRAFSTRPRPRLRAVGALFGVAGIVVTFFAWYEAADSGFGVTDPGSVGHPGAGLFMATAGILIATVGTVCGPYRTTRSLGRSKELPDREHQ